MPNDAPTWADRPRSAFYARVAVANSQERPSIQAMRTLAETNLRQLQDRDWILTEFVLDAGSGRRIEAGLRGLLNSARAGDLNEIVVDRLASLARPPHLLHSILTEFAQAGVSVHVLSSASGTPLDYTTPNGQVAAWILATLTDTSPHPTSPHQHVNPTRR